MSSYIAFARTEINYSLTQRDVHFRKTRAAGRNFLFSMYDNHIHRQHIHIYIYVSTDSHAVYGSVQKLLLCVRFYVLLIIFRAKQGIIAKHGEWNISETEYNHAKDATCPTQEKVSTHQTNPKTHFSPRRLIHQHNNYCTARHQALGYRAFCSFDTKYYI